jgi:hypothetical protein
LLAQQKQLLLVLVALGALHRRQQVPTEIPVQLEEDLLLVLWY